MKKFACIYCGSLHDADADNGIDVRCCGEKGKVRPTFIDGDIEVEMFPDQDTMTIWLWKDGHLVESMDLSRLDMIKLRGLIDEVLSEKLQ